MIPSTAAFELNSVGIKEFTVYSGWYSDV